MISPELIKAIIGAGKSCGAGLATIGLTGAGVGVGLVFASLVFKYVRVPSEAKNVFKMAMLIMSLLCIKVNGEDDDNYEKSLYKWEIQDVIDRVIKDINEKKEINNKKKIDSSILEDEEIDEIYRNILINIQPDAIVYMENVREIYSYEEFIEIINNHIKTLLFFDILERIEEKLENMERGGEYILYKWEIKDVFDRVIKDINEKKEINNKQKIDSSILEDEEINKIYLYVIEALKPSILSLEKQYQKKLEHGQIIELITDYIKTQLYNQIRDRIAEMEELYNTLNEEMSDDDNYEEYEEMSDDDNYDKSLYKWEIQDVFDSVIKHINEKKEINNKKKIDSSILEDEEIDEIYRNTLINIEPDVISLENNYKEEFKYEEFIEIINKHIKTLLFFDILERIEEKLENMERGGEYILYKWEIKDVFDRVIKDINEKKEINNKQKIDSSILEDEEINEMYKYVLIALKPDFISLEKQYQKELEHGQIIELITDHIKTQLYYHIRDRIEEMEEYTLNEEMSDDDNYEEYTLNEEMSDDDNYEEYEEMYDDVFYAKYTLYEEEVKEAFDKVINLINEKKEINIKQKIDSSILEDEEIDEIYRNLLINMRYYFLIYEVNYKEQLKNEEFMAFIIKNIKVRLMMAIYERIKEKLENIEKDKLENMEKTLNEEMYDEDNYEEYTLNEENKTNNENKKKVLNICEFFLNVYQKLSKNIYIKIVTTIFITEILLNIIILEVENILNILYSREISILISIIGIELLRKESFKIIIAIVEKFSNNINDLINNVSKLMIITIFVIINDEKEKKPEKLEFFTDEYKDFLSVIINDEKEKKTEKFEFFSDGYKDFLSLKHQILRSMGRSLKKQYPDDYKIFMEKIVKLEVSYLWYNSFDPAVKKCQKYSIVLELIALDSIYFAEEFLFPINEFNKEFSNRIENRRLFLEKQLEIKRIDDEKREFLGFCNIIFILYIGINIFGIGNDLPENYTFWTIAMPVIVTGIIGIYIVTITKILLDLFRIDNICKFYLVILIIMGITLIY